MPFPAKNTITAFLIRTVSKTYPNPHITLEHAQTSTGECTGVYDPPSPHTHRVHAHAHAADVYTGNTNAILSLTDSHPLSPSLSQTLSLTATPAQSVSHQTGGE
jgi:hypothetical protein